MWQVRIHGCVFHNDNPRSAFAEIDSLIRLDDFVHAEFARLMGILEAYSEATSICGAAISIAKMS
jgi:hypothetical protein